MKHDSEDYPQISQIAADSADSKRKEDVSPQTHRTR